MSVHAWGDDELSCEKACHAPRTLVVVGMRDVEEFVRTKDVQAYMRKWLVTMFDHLFLPVTTARMGWEYKPL